MLPGVSRIRCPHTPGRTFLRPFRNHAAASAVRALGSRSSPSASAFKAKPATARALLFSCPSLQVSADAPVHFFAQAAQVFLFFRLPPCVARLPAVQMDVSPKSHAIIPKNAELSGKTWGLFPLTPQFPDFADTDAQRIPGCLPNYPMQGNIESQFYA